MRKRWIMAALIVLSGCAEKADRLPMPMQVVYKEPEQDRPVSAVEKFMAEIYVMDQNHLVVPQTIPVEANENEEKAALQVLANGEAPEGFQSPLPEGTVIQDVEIKGETAVVSVGGAFANYKEEDEASIASAITWTVTGFEKAERVQLKLNGEMLSAMPVGGMPIAAAGMKREDGINMEAGYTETGATMPITVYFTAQNEQGPYLVPVTRRISMETNDLISASIAELIKGPEPGSGLATEWTPGIKLTAPPAVEEGRAELQFNEEILENNGEALLSSSMLKPLALTLAASANINSVSVKVEGHPDVKLETGAPVPASLTAPLFVNQQSQTSAE